MTYIVLDLEWNQPISYQSSTFRKVGDKLMFEMIQIGAVKLDANLNPGEAISIPIAPTHYVRIHPRIRRMTGLDSETLAGAPAFREALQQFAAWCGDDYTLLTWGIDDVSVLYQNIHFFHCEDIVLPPLCDIQRLFSTVHNLKDRSGLKTAMELVNITPDDTMSFHNALNDAWYTALVFKTLPDPSAVLNYPQEPRPLIHSRHITREKTEGEAFASVRDALSSETAIHPVCPRCGRVLALDGEYIKQSADKYIAVAKCRNHGRILIRLRFRIDDDGKKIMSRTTAPATSANVAYIHTKQLQNQQRQAQYLESHGSLPDPDEELLNADVSSMPFD
uniref:Putative exonuclease family protein n=1 Tax=uncultured bacterium Contig1549a TaxID=1393453 RepID=W0FK29_9BACT|nr:putative exonuclease family protein [uncultured bacterium Contig1549a]